MQLCSIFDILIVSIAFSCPCKSILINFKHVSPILFIYRFYKIFVTK